MTGATIWTRPHQGPHQSTRDHDPPMSRTSVGPLNTPTLSFHFSSSPLLDRSSSSRVRLWKVELRKLADELGVLITVCHLPPGTSKWNKIEHRLFSFSTGNWRGKPLISYQVIVQLIAATTTKTGLEVGSELDPTTHPCGVKVSDDELANINIVRHDFRGANGTI
jgi:hypothetical protein